jgi:squalene-associated FAD-dependent desaturase
MKRVVVVGGGLAGISAALAAADAGASVTLLERRGKLGGLTWSFLRKGRSFDNGQHVFLRCCTAYRRFLTRIGAQEQVFLQPALHVPVLAPGGRRADIRRAHLPTPLHLAPSLARYGHLSVAERVRLGPAVGALRRLDPEDPALDAISFGQWLREHHQSPRAVANLWNLIALPTINVSAEEASLALATMVFRTGLLDDPAGGDIGWSRVPLAQLHGDNSARALAAAGVEVRCGAAVSALDTDGDRPVVSLGDRAIEADAVILAIPPDVAAALVGELAPAAAALGTSPIVNVHLVLDRRVTDLSMAACVDSPVQFFFDRTESAGAVGGEQCLSISLSAADEFIGRRPEELVATFFQALGDVLPEARRARLVDGVGSRERSATFRAVPGTAAHRPAIAALRPGVVPAGAWCATGWPATMEGAVRSGLQAASIAVGSGSAPERLGAPILHGAPA